MTRHPASILLVALALALAGCGGDDDEGGAPSSGGGGGGGDGGGGALTVTADPGGALSWQPGELTASAGTVDIELVNESDVPHAVAIDGVDAASDQVTGGNATLSTELEAGEYTYYCPVGNHRQAGMEGTLSVE